MTAGALMSVFWVVLALLGALCALAFIQGLGRALPVLALGFVLALSPDVSHAKTAASTQFVENLISRASGTGKQTVDFASDGTPLGAPGVPTANTDGGSGVKVDADGNLKNPSGNNQKVNVGGRIANSAVAGKIGKYLAGAVVGGVAGVVVAAVLDLLLEMDWKRDPVTGQLSKKNPTSCTVAPCYEYGGVTFQGASSGWGFREPSSAICSAAQAAGGSTPAGVTMIWLPPPAGNGWGRCEWRNANNTLYTASAVQQRSRTPDAQAIYDPKSLQDLENEIASKSGWPTSSNLAPAAVAAAEALKEKYKVDNPQVTGPAQTPGPAPKVEEKVNPDGSKQRTTTTTVHNHNYAGNTVNTTNVTTTVINNINPQGQTTDTTTVTETEEPEATEDPPTPPTWAPSTVPEVPKLYERKYPEGLVGVWNSRKAELSAGPLSTLASQLMPSVLPAGQCPAWNIELNLGAVSAYAAGWDFGTYNVAPACELWQVAAAIIIVGALILARALVFGG